MGPSLEAFSDAVLALYSAASDPRLWPQSLGAIERLTESAGAIVNIVPKDSPERKALLAGERMAGSFDPALIGDWIENYSPDCPRMAAAATDPSAAYLCDSMLLSEREMDRNAVYDWYTRNDVRYFIGSGLVDAANVHINWSLERANRQGHADSPDVQLFLLLKPHVQRAVTLAMQIGTLSSMEPVTAAAIDALAVAVFALDRSGRVVLGNRRAERLLEHQDGLRCVGPFLQAVAQQENAKFQQLILKGQSGSGGWMRLARCNGGAALLVSLVPLRSTREQGLGPQASVLVFVRDPVDKRPIPPEMLTRLFGFTPAEARLASALAFGHSLQSAAQALGLSVETERAYLKSIFRKAEVNRQQDLVGLLMSLPCSVEMTGA